MLGPRAIYTTLIIYLKDKKKNIGKAITIMQTKQGQEQYHHHHHSYHHHQSFILTSGITPSIASPSLAFAMMTSISAIARTLLLILSLCLANNNYEMIEWKIIIIYLSTILFFYNFITTIETTTFIIIITIITITINMTMMQYDDDDDAQRHLYHYYHNHHPFTTEAYIPID